MPLTLSPTMRESPAYYASRIKELQETQKKIYEDWLDSQHQIFERFMKEFDNMLKSLQEKDRARRKKVRKAKRRNPTRKRKAKSKRRARK